MKDRWQPSELEAIKRLACEAARELGAADVRIAPAHPDQTAREAMRAAFARGDFTTWRYDDEYARKASAPEHVLAGAQSVICIAMPYRTGEPAPAPLTGRVSNYAWSADYHHRVKAILAHVAKRVDEAAGEPVTAIACDTKPLAERAFAARAGLGWVGKHTNLIHPRAGSFVFLGEIVTTLPLAADAPLRKHCGSCTRCVTACPTGALRGDYTIDATRCIADLTQRTDPIPHEMRPLMGTWVWGCDICQVVCPPNERASARGDETNRPLSTETSTPALIRLLQLRSGEFKRTYARTAMGWRGAAVLRRNAAVALGNSLDRAAIPALFIALREDSHPMVRSHAAWALGRIGGNEALALLRETLASEQDSTVRAEIETAVRSAGTAAPPRALEQV